MSIWTESSGSTVHTGAWHYYIRQGRACTYGTRQCTRGQDNRWIYEVIAADSGSTLFASQRVYELMD